MTSPDPTSDDRFGQRMRQAVDALPDAPVALRRAAIGLWPQAPAAQPLRNAIGAMLGQVFATLSFDSWAAPAVAAGMRSMRSPTRHMLFSAMGRDIDLRISPVADAWSLAGQILGPDDSGGIELVSETSPGQPSHLAQLDALGEFRIDGVGAGTYRLTLRTGNDEIVLPPVEVGPGA